MSYLKLFLNNQYCSVHNIYCKHYKHNSLVRFYTSHERIKGQIIIFTVFLDIKLYTTSIRLVKYNVTIYRHKVVIAGRGRKEKSIQKN